MPSPACLVVVKSEPSVAAVPLMATATGSRPSLNPSIARTKVTTSPSCTCKPGAVASRSPLLPVAVAVTVRMGVSLSRMVMVRLVGVTATLSVGLWSFTISGMMMVSLGSAAESSRMVICDVPKSSPLKLKKVCAGNRYSPPDWEVLV